MSEKQLFEDGLAIRREVLGSEYVDGALSRASEFNAELQDLVTEFCWGTIWTRPGLDRRTRSLMNLTMLVALRQWSELGLHVRGAIHNGCTVAEIREALLQTVIYCGVPAGVEAFRVANAVLVDMGESAADPGSAARHGRG